MEKTIDILSRHRETIKSSFAPPAGYLDTLKSRVMAQLPPPGASGTADARAKRPVRRHLLPRVIGGIAAAAACAAAVWVWPFRGTAMESLPESTRPASVAAASEESSEKYIDDLYNYAMLDRYDYYDYLLEYY